MPTFFRRARFLLVALLPVLCPGSSRAAGPEEETSRSERVIRAGVETHSEPYTYALADGRAAGYSVELLHAIAREQNLRVEYVVLDWPQLLAAFKAGTLDVICNVADTPERHAYMDFTVPTVLMLGGIYQREGTPPVLTLADLAGRRLAVPHGSRADEYIRTHRFPCELVPAPTLQACLDAVHLGEADLMLATKLSTGYLIKRDGYTNVRLAGLQLPDFQYRMHIGVRKNDSTLLAQLNDGLLALTRNGTYDAMFERWIGPLEPRSLRWLDVRNYVYGLAFVLALLFAAFLWQRHILRRVKQQAGKLRRSEERLQLVFESTQDGFWDCDLTTGLTTRSRRWADMLGYTLEEIGPSDDGFRRLVHPDDLPVLDAVIKATSDGQDFFYNELRMRAKNGDWIWILDRGKVVARDPQTGKPLRMAGTHTDVTARKLAEDEAARLQHKMVEAQKLESLGFLAGGIAHDFNNLLTVILGSAALVRMEPGLNPDSAAHLDKTIAAANRAADLCRQLLAYAGRGAYTTENIDLNILVSETTRLLELSLGRARLEFSLQPGLPVIEGDPPQMRQLVMNLVLNAAEAIEGHSGTIRISTAVTPIGAAGLPHALPAGHLPVGDYVRLEIADTGSGMTPAVMARMFDPFFTTKFTGRGLGLAAVLGIVRAQHGALTVSSTPGQGSVFSIYIPVARAVVPSGPGHHPVGTVPPGAGTARAESAASAIGRSILVADDDEAVRTLLVQMLKRLGHHPVAVEDGLEAVQIFTADPDRFHLIVCDITMPRLDGLAALEQIHAARPGVPAILLSGHSVEDTRHRLGAIPGMDFLQKPFTYEALRECLRGLLA
ncbi:MAG: transporter substrate-binding domain-containing protein [Opitutales bacterium]